MRFVDFQCSSDKCERRLDLLYRTASCRRFFAIAAAVIPFLNIGTTENHENYGCGYVNDSGCCEYVIPFSRCILGSENMQKSHTIRLDIVNNTYQQ